MVNASREAFARGEFVTTEELLEDIRKRKFMEENGLGPKDMELDIWCSVKRVEIQFLEKKSQIKIIRFVIYCAICV